MQFDSNSKMKQVHMSNGGPWGGIRVNERLYEYLEEVFGETVMIEFASEYCFEDFILRMDIEREKRKVQESSDTKESRDAKESSNAKGSFKLSFPDSLRKTWKRIEKKKGKKAYDKKGFEDMIKEHGLLIKGGCLLMDSDKVRQYLKDTVDGILTCLKDILEGEDHKGLQIDAMIIVGGFAESPYVIETLRKGLELIKVIPVVRPQEPWKAVLFGAVLFGQNKDIITSRIMRHTYGVGVVREFDPKLHNLKEKFEDGRNVWANNVFSKHVTLNQSVKLNEWIAGKDYYPDSEKETPVSVYLYSSDKLNPIHTNEDGCRYIGRIDVDFGKSEKDRKKTATVEFSFGGTELEVRAVIDTSGKEFIHRLAIS